MPIVTWDPANKAAAIALSGSNLIATSSAGSGTINAAVIATQAISPTVKEYFEVTITGTNGQYFTVGVMNSAAPLSANMGATNGAGLSNKISGTLTRTYLNGVQGGTNFPVFASGQVVRVAVDRAANRMWWAVNNNIWTGTSVWMGDGTTGADPATGVGGLNISSVTGNGVFPTISSAWTGDVATFNGGTAAFAYAVPSGFVGIDTVAAFTPANNSNVTQAAVEHWASVAGTGLGLALGTQFALEHWASVVVPITARQNAVTVNAS